MPTVGETVSQGAPEVAVKEIGELSVDNVTVCGAEGSGGAVKLSVAGFKDNVEGAEVTFNVTITTAGELTPMTVMVTDDIYTPTARLSGLTLTAMVAGNTPLSVFTVSQKSVAGAAVVNVGLPALAFTDTFCDFGRVAAPD